MRSQRGFGIVEMQCFEIGEADFGVEFGENLVEAGWVAKVVSGCEDMTGVETDSDTGFVLDEGDDVGEVGECGADHVAGAGHCF